jgi:hypothetical protein
VFYVYQYLREDGSPYYIGKGKDNRAWSYQRTINRPPDDRIVIIKNNLTEDEAHELEIELIRQYGRKDLGTGILRNMTDGGEGASGRITSEVTKSKISEANIGKPGTRNGHKNSQEHTEALIRANTGNSYCTGRIRPEDEIEKIRNSNTGKKRSIETKKKLSESHLGKKDSDETKAKKSKSASKPKSEEHRENIRLSKLGEKNPMFGKPSPNKGKSMSEEQKEKIRQSMLRNGSEKSDKFK